MRVVYADEVFLINTAADYVLLLVSARVSGYPVTRRTIVPAAVAGGGYAVAASVWGGALLTPPAKLTAGLLLALFAFGTRKHFWRLALLFFGVSAAFAGGVTAIQYAAGTGPGGLRTLAASFLAFYGLFAALFGGSAGHAARAQLVPVTVRRGGNRVRFTALADSGNTLRDPVSGARVTVASRQSVSPLFDRETAEALRAGDDPAGLLLRLGGQGFRLIPYRALGKEGLLLAFRPDSLTRAGKREENALVAIAAEDLEEGRGYTALTWAE